jgi:hypothetical protein
MKSPIRSLRPFLSLALGLTFVGAQGCASAYRESVGGLPEVYTRVYLTDFNTAWQASLDALNSIRIDAPNKEAGIIQTKWTDNTLAKNFAERGTFMKAQFRFLINVAKGFYEGQPSVKVTVQKEQMIQRDVLDGWKRVESDSIEERTLLYRLGRIIAMKTEMAKIEEQKIQKQIESSGF